MVVTTLSILITLLLFIHSLRLLEYGLLRLILVFIVGAVFSQCLYLRDLGWFRFILYAILPYFYQGSAIVFLTLFKHLIIFVF